MRKYDQSFRRFPSCISPLFQSKSCCVFFDMEICLITCKLHVNKLISIWNISHLDSFWNRRCERKLGNWSLFYSTASMFLYALIFFFRPLLISPSTMAGSKKLSIPKTCNSFVWNAPEVLSLCSQGALYIMAKILPLRWPTEDVSLEVFRFM